MPAGIGYSFSPFQDDAQGHQPPAEQVQNAIQVLGLRMPTVAGARGIAPQPLLNSQGAGGLNIPQGLSLQQFLAFLFGQMPGLGPDMAGPSPASRPVPGITPGAGPGTGQPTGGAPEKQRPSPIDLPPPQGIPNPPGIGPGQPVPPPSLPGFDPTPTADRSNPLPGNRGGGGPLNRPYPMGFIRR